MLVLSREEGEEIVITATSGEVIRFRIQTIGRKQVSISFDAPPSVVIDRAEVHERRQRGVQ
jgi:carbon storage regulator CsrA